MPRSLLILCAAIAAGYLLVCVLAFLGQRSLVYFPVPRDARAPLLVLHRPDAAVHVTVRPQAGSQALLYFGGNAEDVSAQLGPLSALFPRHSLYLLHYRGYGGSEGRPNEAALHADAAALFDHVQATHPDIIVIGRSLGSGLAVRLASVRPVARLVLVTPFDSLVQVAATHYPWLPVRWLLRERYESWRDASAISAPTTLIVAEHDSIVPPARAHALLAHFPAGRASLHVVPGADHNTLDGKPRYAELLQRGE